MNTIKASYLVEGMSCSGCERTVQRIVQNVSGVTAATADLKSATVSVEYDPSKTTLDQIRAAINSVGYKLVGERPARGERESSDESIS